MQILSMKKKCNQEEIVEKIILEQYNRYYRLALQYVHNEADACDIVQNGAYKALRSAHTLKNPEYAATWIYRIMLNEAMDFVRRPKAESYESLQDEQGHESKYTLDTYEDIDLRRALEALPKEEKAIIIMRYFEDRRLEEIAEILGENLNTVKSKLYRSMKKLRVQLTGE